MYEVVSGQFLITDRRQTPVGAARQILHEDRTEERNMRESAIVLRRKGGSGAMGLQERAGVPYLFFPSFEETGLVVHGFSTRLGGVSSGDCATMNFAVNRGDTPENVRENYRRMARALDFQPERLVVSMQTHTVNIRRVTEADAGKGFDRERDYADVDGLMTDVPGLVLVTSYADCVPLLFVDPVKRVVAASHSGWRGTVARMGRCTVEAMRENYGCRPEDLLAGIGPCICPDCYEVGEDVAEKFRKGFGVENVILKPAAGRPGKYQLDLREANMRILLEAGVRPEHISVTDICTCCNKDVIFSHRGSGGRRGNMGAFLGLR